MSSERLAGEARVAGLREAAEDVVLQQSKYHRSPPVPGTVVTSRKAMERLEAALAIEDETRGAAWDQRTDTVAVQLQRIADALERIMAKQWPADPSRRGEGVWWDR